MCSYKTTQKIINTSCGPLLLEATDTHLIRAVWLPESYLDSHNSGFSHKNPASGILDEAEKQLREYFAGDRMEFQLPLLMTGTEFQLRAMDALSKVPYGRTISYRQLAEMADCRKGYRAVANACHRNPLVIFYPCHRVIASDGGPGGYAAGLDTKLTLLNLEFRMENLECRINTPCSNCP